MQSNQNSSSNERSVLASLRSLVPRRSLQFSELLRLAELQANRLLQLCDIEDGPVPSEVVSELPRIRLEYRDLPTSGLSFWDGKDWVICLNASEPRTRQRFTLLHEYKHVVDHSRVGQLYAGNYRHTVEEQAEQAADYFAGCALMPKRLLKRAWGEGLQRPTAMAARFHVSARAIEVRLAQLGLTEPRPRCTPTAALPRRTASWRRGPYRRALSLNWPVVVSLSEVVG